MTNQQIAETILQQLGGSKFRTMTGAKNFVAADSELRFSLPSNFASNKANRVSIKLNAMDLYEMRFFTVRGMTVKEIGEPLVGIYGDKLCACFEQATGLRTRLF